MRSAYVVTGHLKGTHTVELDETLPVSSARVRVVLEVLSSPSATSHNEVLAQIHDRQRKRGHQPPSRAEVDAQIEEERNSWGQ
jgi:hypothetical protein